MRYKAIKRRSKTHCHNLVKRLLYNKELNTNAIKYGRMNEEKKEVTDVKKCGIFLDINHSYLGASPDGLLPEDGIIEVKCLPSLLGHLLKDTIKKVCFKVVNGRICLKKNHNYTIIKFKDN